MADLYRKDPDQNHQISKLPRFREKCPFCGVERYESSVSLRFSRGPSSGYGCGGCDETSSPHMAQWCVSCHHTWAIEPHDPTVGKLTLSNHATRKGGPRLPLTKLGIAFRGSPEAFVLPAVIFVILFFVMMAILKTR